MGQRDQQIVAPERDGAALGCGQARLGVAQQFDHIAGLRVAAQIVARQLQGFAQHAGRYRNARGNELSLHQALRQVQGLGGGQRLEPHLLEGETQTRPLLQQLLQRGGLHFPHHADAAGLDRRQEQIQQPVRAEAVPAGVVELVEIGHVPEHAPRRVQVVLHLLYAPLDLADIDLAREHVDRGGLEDGPAFDPSARAASRLKSAVFPVPDSPVMRKDCGGVCSKALQPSVHRRGQHRVLDDDADASSVVPNPAHRLQEGHVDARFAPLPESFAQPAALAV